MEARDTNEPERLLEHLATPPARPEFKARLREAFVNGASAAGIDIGAALDRLPVPAARPEFKSELRARFLGAAAAPGTARGTRPTRSQRSPGPARTQSRRLRLVAGGLGLAAAAALILIFLRTGDPGGWVIEHSVAQARDEFVIDGRPHPAGLDAEDLARSLRTASEVSTGSAPVTLRFADQFVVLMEPGSTLGIGELEADPARWQLHAERGNIRIGTGPAYRADTRLLRVTTPHTEVEAHGTLFGLDVDEAGTCTCCLEQTLVGSFVGGKLEPIPSEHSMYVARSAPSARMAGTQAPHLPALRAMVLPAGWR